MKRIENKVTSVTDSSKGETKQLTYVDLLKVIMNIPPAQGYTIEEMRSRLAIFSKLDEKASAVELEDAEFKILKDCVLAFRWGTMNADIVAFVDYLSTL